MAVSKIFFIPGEMIQFDLRIFFNWLGSTTNYIDFHCVEPNVSLNTFPRSLVDSLMEAMRANVSNMSARFVDNFSRVTFPVLLGGRFFFQGEVNPKDSLLLGHPVAHLNIS